MVEMRRTIGGAAGNELGVDGALGRVKNGAFPNDEACRPPQLWEYHETTACLDDVFWMR